MAPPLPAALAAAPAVATAPSAAPAHAEGVATALSSAPAAAPRKRRRQPLQHAPVLQVDALACDLVSARARGVEDIQSVSTPDVDLAAQTSRTFLDTLWRLAAVYAGRQAQGQRLDDKPTCAVLLSLPDTWEESEPAAASSSSAARAAQGDAPREEEAASSAAGAQLLPRNLRAWVCVSMSYVVCTFVLRCLHV